MADSTFRLDLTVLSGVSAGDIFHFDLAEGGVITIGRAADNDLVLQDPTVSRKHGEIRKSGNGFELIDVGSSSGTMHMGFKLHPGPGGARLLGNGDEFKIGEAIFRVSYDEDKVLAAKKKSTPVAETPGHDATVGGLPPVQQPPLWKRRKVVLPVAGAALVALLLLLVVPGSKPAPPKQLSNVPMTIPQERVIGYFKSGKERDFSHLDKAQFLLPASDILVEFDYRSQAPLDVSIDHAKLRTLDASPGLWQHAAVVVRDPLVGAERRLIVDNTGYPAPKPKKKWAVRDIRATPLSRPPGISLDTLIEQTIAQTERLDKNPEGLFGLIRSTQRSVLQQLADMNLDGAVIVAAHESQMPSAEEIRQELQSILRERLDFSAQNTMETAVRHLSALAALAGRLDAELWRRVKNRWNIAKLAAAAKNYIDAHDNLKAAMSMFPDQIDHRWVLTDRMFNDKKIVPKRVRQKPQKFRKP